jgi:hypothetical protein
MERAREITSGLLVLCLLFCEESCEGDNVEVDLLRAAGCQGFPNAIRAISSHREGWWSDFVNETGT